MELNKDLTVMEIIIIIEKQCGDILILHFNFIHLFKQLINVENKLNIIIMIKLLFFLIINF